MSLENLSKPALEALLAFHTEAARRIEEQLRATVPLTASESDVSNDGTDTEGALFLPEQSGDLLSPFNQSDSHCRATAPSPSPPSTPVRNRSWISSPPSARMTWPIWSREVTSPTPISCDRKRRRGEEDDSTEPERVRRRIDPGWPRGYIRTQPRRRHLWDKENEKHAL